MQRRAFISAFLASAISSRGQLNFDQRDSKLPPQVAQIYRQGLAYLIANEASWTKSGTQQPGITALAVMSILAHGNDPERGESSKIVKDGLASLISQQKSTGYIGGSMYNHGFATLALAEAYGMVKIPNLGKSLKKGVDLILSSQKANPLGGWRYGPASRDADSTVTGAQLVALFAAKNAGLFVPDKAIERGLAYMESCRTKNGSYAYTEGSSSGNPTLTAIGVLNLCLAKKRDQPSFKASVDYLKSKLNHRENSYPYYFEYYMSQALFQADPESWAQWNSQNIRYLSTIQSADGSFPGNFGPVFCTAGALLSLALNYRFLPIYEK